jgi:hypothetical protein
VLLLECIKLRLNPQGHLDASEPSVRIRALVPEQAAPSAEGTTRRLAGIAHRVAGRIAGVADCAARCIPGIADRSAGRIPGIADRPARCIPGIADCAAGALRA